jgi:nitrate/nitrite-specific signal transduction histidine kinase
MSEIRSVRYVERVREATRALFDDLLESNRRLGLSIAVLGRERDAASRDDLEELNKRSERWRAEQLSVLGMLETIDREYKRFEEQFYDVERQNANLATLYAAGHALHASLDRKAVLAAIQEIVINLVGSEELAIVAADEQLTPLALFGVTAERLRGLTPESGLIGRALAEQRPLALLRGMPSDATRVRVCIPLELGGKVIGFVLIFGFLPQKDDISPLDQELFGLLGTQAAAALHAADAFARSGATGAG